MTDVRTAVLTAVDAAGSCNSRELAGRLGVEHEQVPFSSFLSSRYELHLVFESKVTRIPAHPLKKEELIRSIHNIFILYSYYLPQITYPSPAPARSRKSFADERTRENLLSNCCF